MKNKWMGIVIMGWLLTAPAWAGIYYAAVTESEGGGKSAGMRNSSMQAWVDGDQARIEFVQAGNNPMI